MTHTDQSPEHSETTARTFLIEALHNLSRTAALLAIVLAGFGVLLALFAYILLPAVFNAASSHISEISFAGTTPTIRIRQKGGSEAYILSVPAAELNVATGIRLEPDKTYTLRASGTVSTTKGLKYLPAGSPPKEELRNWNPNWRDPDGRYLYYEGDPNPETDCVAALSNKLRLDTNARYGSLLALLVKGNEPPNYRAYKNGQEANFIVVQIGRGRAITYDRQRARLVIRDITGSIVAETDASYLGDAIGSLYLQVNDTVITDPSQFDLGHCRERATQGDIAWRKYSRSVYEQIQQDRQRSLMAPGVWYLDNDGSFIVNIVVN